jgi:hypothetical protein
MEPLAEGTCPSLWERKVRPESAGGAILATAVRRNALIAHGRGLEPFEHGDVPLATRDSSSRTPWRDR